MCIDICCKNAQKYGAIVPSGNEDMRVLVGEGRRGRTTVSFTLTLLVLYTYTSTYTRLCILFLYITGIFFQNINLLY